MTTWKEPALRSHLLCLVVQPVSHGGVYQYFNKKSVHFTKLTKYLYSVSSRPNSINIMISDSYVDDIDIALHGLRKSAENDLRPHFKQIIESARQCKFNKELFNPKPWSPLKIRHAFMKDSAPVVIPIIVNELEKGGLIKWCKDLCAKLGINSIPHMDLLPHIGSPPNPNDTKGSMDHEMNEILTATFNICFDKAVALIRADA